MWDFAELSLLDFNDIENDFTKLTQLKDIKFQCFYSPILRRRFGNVVEVLPMLLKVKMVEVFVIFMVLPQNETRQDESEIIRYFS